MDDQRYQIGIVGYGDFTRLMCEYLGPYADIIVSSRQRDEGDAGYGARFAPLAEVLARSVILPSFPSQHFEALFKEHGEVVNKDAVVIDVCSVKVHPLNVLKQYLPEATQIIGTHPMFGPASVKENGGIEGLKCVITPVRVNDRTLARFEHFIETVLKLRVIHRTPDQHDREMAYVQGLSHYIARLMDAMDIPETEMATLAYEDLYSMKQVQAQDSWGLFYSIMKDNPYAHTVNNEFKEAIKALDAKILTNSAE